MKKNSIILTLVLFVIVALSCTGSSKKTENNRKTDYRSIVAQNGRLQVIGTQLSNEKGEPVVLRGASLGWHNLWPRFYNKNAVQWLADDWKCTVVRAAMGLEIEDNYRENPEFALQCITPVIESAIENGIYVIIDFHAHNKYTEEAKTFFAGMAEKYGEYPNVIYEIWNEPDYFEWEEVKTYSEEVIAVIRAIDPDNIILVGSPHWDQDLHLVAEDPIRDVSNIMYTMHFYAATHEAWLRDRTDEAIAKGIPVFVSECGGSEANGDGRLGIEEWKTYVDWMESRKISWVAWSVSDKNETCSMLLPRASADGNWTEDLLKPWGKLTRNSIRNANDENPDI
ncbi:MAG: glycoside hydrolase family 5 protein [Proteiniphilum sp.]|uniref:glycoside hydrolase family 5 protein n=1 Tax=Proteiniphilum sp. TaxID=1926877 RepID=UPI0007C62366|nr:glycoside hydrolase family 5 protein [Proteiniphilum sp.]AND74761.1 cellulase GH5 [uncultured bacterium]MDY9917623.1 glycoside hydrolase family 5 protein [Proteiniphilum sp.]